MLYVGDERTAEDAYQFLQGFLGRYPEYAGRPFWIAGESYGGHYVPNLAFKVPLSIMPLAQLCMHTTAEACRAKLQCLLSS